jgi:hypothetical protein
VERLALLCQLLRRLLHLYILHTAVSVEQNKSPEEVVARFDEAEGARARDWHSSTAFKNLERYPEAQVASSYAQTAERSHRREKQRRWEEDEICWNRHWV